MHPSFMQDFNPWKFIVGLLGCGVVLGAVLVGIVWGLVRWVF